MSQKIRQGNDIDITWYLVDADEQPYILDGRNISIEVVIGAKKHRIKEFDTNLNAVHFVYRGKDQKYIGSCDLKFIENDGENEMVTFDTKDAFTLVSHSWLAVDTGEEPERIYLEYTTVTSTLNEKVGPTGPAAGFGVVDAEADDNIGTPAVDVETSGPDTAKNIHFKFKNIKGKKGDKGDEPVITADEHGNLYADGVLLTDVVKNTVEAVDAAEAQRVLAEQGRVEAEQGRVLAEHGRVEQASSDHTRAEADHGTASGDHTRAESDHSTAYSDHGTANNDHARAESDHSTALIDHATAGNDHTRAESDHSAASGDHTQAGQDHTRAESDHSTASSDHTTAASDHVQAGQDHSTASADHTQAGQDHTRAEGDHSTASSDHSTAAADHTRAEGDHTRAESDHESIADKADVDGYNPLMGVGVSEGLVDKNGIGSEQSIRFRQHGKEAGIADIQGIRGRTVKFNQLIQNGNFENDTANWSRYGQAFTFSVSNHRCKCVCTNSTQGADASSIMQSVPMINGHQYIILFGFQSSDNITPQFEWVGIGAASTASLTVVSANHYAKIVTGTLNDNKSILFKPQGTRANDMVWYWFDINVVDLTLIFGSGNEPSTVADFEAWLSANLGLRDYYPYTPGSLVNCSVKELVSAGFNQWDEEWELGVFDSNGNKAPGDRYIADNTTIRSKNYVPVVPGEYYSAYQIIVYCYDAYKNYIAGLVEYNYNGCAINANNGVFTIPDGVAYITFRCTSGYGTTYKKDVCINISDSTRNGQYEPYKGIRVPLNLDSFQVKDAQGNLTTISGLKSNGENSDEIKGGKTYIQRVGSRAYQSGDESDSSVTTDGTNTYYTLTTPVEYELVNPINPYYKVYKNGTEEAVADALTTPLTADIYYNPDYVKEIVNLPTNYVRRDALKQSTGADETLPMSQKAATESFFKVTDLTLADGLVDTLSAGTEQEFVYRQAGGDGVNYVKRLKGNTRVWNQLVKNGNFVNTGYWNTIGANLTVNNNIATIAASQKNGGINQQNVLTKEAGHKMLVKVVLKTTASANDIQVYMYGGYASIYNSGSGMQVLEQIVTTNSAWGSDLTNNNSITIRDTRSSDWDAILVYSVISCDLTLLFNGSVPANYTVADFERDYPELYYGYNAGELTNNDAESLESEGANLWDEEWEVGGLDNDTGQPMVQNNRIRSKNFIPCMPNTDYFGRITNNPETRTLHVYYYDASKNYISMDSGHGNLVITSPAGARYMKFRTYTDYGTTYKNDICINLSNASFNGTYEPHWKKTLNIGITSLTGKLNGEGDSVVILPDGARSAGSVYDYGVVENGYLTKIVTCLNKYVFTGEETWQAAGEEWIAKNILTGVGASYSPFVCDKQYVNAILNGQSYPQAVKTIGAAGQTADAVAQNMAGASLYYTLATPQTYILDNPIPMTLLVDKLGTERAVFPTHTSGSPSAPFKCDSNYSISIKNLVAALNQQ